MVTLLGLERKMNSSFHGNAQGVGSSPIVGIVEHVTCRIGDVGFRSFFLVLEGSMPYCILGLDQMRRFNCVVDVGGNALIFGGRDGVSVPFLPQEDAASVAFAMMTRNDPPAQAEQEQQPQNAKPPPQHEHTKSGAFGTFTPWGRKNQGGR
jgi:DNA damage-inducible protein 1